MDLADRLRKLRTAKGVSQEQLAQKTQLSVEQIKRIEETADATIQELVQVSTFFNADLNWFIMGTGAKTFAMDYIQLINAEVAAGYLEKKHDPTFFSQLEYYRIPGFPKGGNHRIFLVHGDSMYPTISEDDHLVCSEVKDIGALETGDMAVLVTDGDIVVKRIRHVGESLILDSDNPKFKSYSLELGEIREIWRVEAKVTKLIERNAEGKPHPEGVADDVKSMKQQIASFKAELEKLKQQFEGGASEKQEKTD